MFCLSLMCTSGYHTCLFIFHTNIHSQPFNLDPDWRFSSASNQVLNQLSSSSPAVVSLFHSWHQPEGFPSSSNKKEKLLSSMLRITRVRFVLTWAELNLPPPAAEHSPTPTRPPLPPLLRLFACLLLEFRLRPLILTISEGLTSAPRPLSLLLSTFEGSEKQEDRLELFVEPPENHNSQYQAGTFLSLRNSLRHHFNKESLVWCVCIADVCSS